MIERLKHEERISRRSFLTLSLAVLGSLGMGTIGGIIVSDADRARIRELEEELVKLKQEPGTQQIIYTEGTDRDSRQKIRELERRMDIQGANMQTILDLVKGAAKQEDLDDLRRKVENIMFIEEQTSNPLRVPEGGR